MESIYFGDHSLRGVGYARRDIQWCYI